jgi:hypothetical protein
MLPGVWDGDSSSLVSVTKGSLSIRIDILLSIGSDQLITITVSVDKFADERTTQKCGCIKQMAVLSWQLVN